MITDDPKNILPLHFAISCEYDLPLSTSEKIINNLNITCLKSTDLTPEEMKKIEDQVNKIKILPVVLSEIFSKFNDIAKSKYSTQLLSCNNLIQNADIAAAKMLISEIQTPPEWEDSKIYILSLFDSI